jgi:hypothetical protein
LSAFLPSPDVSRAARLTRQIEVSLPRLAGASDFARHGLLLTGRRFLAMIDALEPAWILGLGASFVDEDSASEQAR